MTTSIDREKNALKKKKPTYIYGSKCQKTRNGVELSQLGKEHVLKF